MSETGVSTATKTRPRVEDQPDVDEPRMWHVVLLDDDDHVIRMMQELFACSLERAFELAEKVDHEGRAICITTHREHAELKQEQIHSYGPDKLIARCSGPMSAILEPADYGDDDDLRDDD
jgi:ATP-dependent Clp protease adaptor protein ClpS